MENYYYEIKGEKIGPLTIKELTEKDIYSNTLIWKESIPDWTYASNLKELDAYIIPTPPDLPKNRNKTAIILKKIIFSLKWSFIISIIISTVYFLFIDGFFKFSQPIDETQLTYQYYNYSEYNTDLHKDLVEHGMIGSAEYGFGHYNQLVHDFGWYNEINSKDQMIDIVNEAIVSRKKKIVNETFELFFIALIVSTISIILIQTIIYLRIWLDKTSNSK